MEEARAHHVHRDRLRRVAQHKVGAQLGRAWAPVQPIGQILRRAEPTHPSPAPGLAPALGGRVQEGLVDAEVNEQLLQLNVIEDVVFVREVGRVEQPRQPPAGALVPRCACKLDGEARAARRGGGRADRPGEARADDEERDGVAEAVYELRNKGSRGVEGRVSPVEEGEGRGVCHLRLELEHVVARHRHVRPARGLDHQPLLPCL